MKVKKKHGEKLRARGVKTAADPRQGYPVPFDPFDKLRASRLRAGGTWIGNRELRIFLIEKNGIIFYTSGTYGITIA